MSEPPGTPAADVGGRRVIVLGLGVTGRAVAAVLAERGARVLASDAGDPADRLALEELAARDVEIETGGHDRAAAELDEADFVVPSPGISPHRGFLADVVAGGVRIVSELDLAVTFTTAPVLAVTGTNGKTTVCRLAERIAREAGLKAFMCGNTEIPFVSAADEHPDADLFVVEASSFRLAFCTTFHPRVSVITNLAPDHLDWHESMDSYRDAKARIAARQSHGDLFLYPDAQPDLAALAPGGPARMPFGVQPVDDGDGAWVDGDEIVVRLGERTIRASGMADLVARGAHFAADAAAAAAALIFLGARPDAIERALGSFEVAQHRLEPVGTLNGVSVIDDSVSANAHATVAAVRHVSSGDAADPRVVLIAGGRNKGIDLSPLATQAAQIKCVVALGEASEELANVFAESGVPVKIVGSMNEAVGVALSEARPGDVVLMSPACASFDMFRGYADRGRAFLEACQAHGVKLDAALRLP